MKPISYKGNLLIDSTSLPLWRLVAGIQYVQA